MSRQPLPVGTERETRDGYVRVKTADRGWVPRAVLVAEHELGRRLVTGEHVTHGPAGTADDRPQNLRLQSSELLEAVALEANDRGKAGRARQIARLAEQRRQRGKAIQFRVSYEDHEAFTRAAAVTGQTLPNLAKVALTLLLSATTPISCGHKLTNVEEVGDVC